MKYLPCCLLLSLILSAEEVKPYYHWNFENAAKTEKGYKVPSIGTDNSFALNCKEINPEEKSYVVFDKDKWNTYLPKLNWGEAVLEFEFKGTLPVKNQATLLSYTEAPWYVGYMEVYLSPAGELGVDIRQTFDKRYPEFQYKDIQQKYHGVPILLEPGKWHKVSIVMNSGKEGMIFLDGKKYAKTSDSKSFSDFSPKKIPLGYPLLSIGHSLRDPSGVNYFNGEIRDIRFYKGIKDCGESSPIAAPTSSTDKNSSNLLVKLCSEKPVLDGKLTDSCWKNAEWSCPFTVKKVPHPSVTGLFLPPDKKFVDTASTAALAYDEKYLYVAIRSPVPQDMKPRTGSGFQYYNRDCIEFFVRFDNLRYFQFLMNPGGPFQELDYHISQGTGVLNPSPAAIVKGITEDHEFTLEMAIPWTVLGNPERSDGMQFFGNFCRSGTTAGGQSQWRITSGFLAPFEFGTFILGNRGDWWLKRVADFRTEIEKAGLKTTALEEKTVIFSKEIVRNGNHPDSQKILEKEFRKLNAELVQLKNANRTYLVWDKNIWSSLSPYEIPFNAKEITSLQLTSPAGCRAINGFVFTNLSEKAFMGRLVLQLDKFDISKIKFREVGFIESNGRMIADPVFDLPLDCIIRIPANSSGFVLLNADLRGVAPGKYTGILSIHPSYEGFSRWTIPFELNVLPFDLSSVHVQNFTYSWGRAHKKLINLLSYYEINTIYCNPRKKCYPKADKDGKILQFDFHALDSLIQEHVDAGIAVDQIHLMIMAEFKLFKQIAYDRDYVCPAEFLSPAWKKVYQFWLEKTRDHLLDKWGIGYDRFFIYMGDETEGDPDNVKSSNHTILEAAKFLKSVDPKIRLMINPKTTPEERKHVEKLLPYVDIIEPYYGHIINSEAYAKHLRKKVPEQWAYDILSNTNAPTRYRGLFWDNLKKGLGSVAAFWSLDDFAGDSLNPADADPRNPKAVTDYGTLYNDIPREQYISSRRMEAWYQGFNDYRTVIYCMRLIEQKRKEHCDVSKFEKELEDIIQSTDDYDSGREKLFNLIQRVSNERSAL